jgi:hypothetical protein
MAALTADKSRVFENTGPHPEYDEQPVAAAALIYAGAAVSIDGSGNARSLVVADAKFAGFAGARVNNSASAYGSNGVAGAAGARRVNLFARGYVKLSVTGVSSNVSKDAAVYATDEDTFTLTSTSALQIGKVSRWISGTTCLVYFESTSLRSI